VETITSRENPVIKELAGLLTQKKLRDRTGLFALEGVRLCVDTAQSGVRVRTLLLTPQARGQYPECETLEKFAKKTLLIENGLAQRISDTKTPQGVFCICEKLDNQKSAVTMKRSGKYLVLADLQDPRNFGAILRTAQALGVDGVFACCCPDLYSPKMLRSAMGGQFRLPLEVHSDAAAAVARLRQTGVPVYAAALDNTAQMLGSVDLSGGCAMLIGNEGNGLSRELIAACSGNVIIPMRCDANSLNAASAAAILLWEMCKDTAADT